MTDIHCDKLRCLNNRRGWCAANAIHIDDGCKSCVTSLEASKHSTAKVMKKNGKWKAQDNLVLK